MLIEPKDLDVIFLDAAGTLFEVRGSVGRVYSEVALNHGVVASADDLDTAFADAFRRMSRDGIPGGGDIDLEAREKRWWLGVVREVFGEKMPPAALQKYFEEVFETFRRAEAWRLYPDTCPSLERLRSGGYRLGIVSNFDSRLRDVLCNLGIGYMFEQVTLSWRAGAAKPDAAIFRSALGAMSVPAARAIHVGDSLQDDVAGAQAAGMRAVLLDRNNLHAGWAGGWRIRGLNELCDSLLPSKEM